MKLIFEISGEGRGTAYLPDCDVPEAPLPAGMLRANPPRLPEVAESELVRHYTRLSQQAFGVNCGFYPLGSCTMKYNPRINEAVASLEGFAAIHPLQPADTTRGCAEAVIALTESLCEITGMDALSLQPAAGAHGEFLGLLLMKKYHASRQDTGRTRIIVPDSAHGTNPASAAMVGYSVVNVPSDANGCVDMQALTEVLDDRVAGLMLTNPNTLGLFDPNVLKITALVHRHGGLCYYDGANLNAIMGRVRPGDMGFDMVHLNLHKTFSTPHGGGGPGSGPVGCKAFLKDYLPYSALGEKGSTESVGQLRAFYGNFAIALRALAYIRALGAEGLREASETAVLNANYLCQKLKPCFPVAYNRSCMHEFVLSLEAIKKETGVSALDVAKALIDHGIHPPTMYFPLIVHEALMFEPTETETRETLDEAARVMGEIRRRIDSDPESLRLCPQKTPISRPDEVAAARNPVVRYAFDA